MAARLPWVVVTHWVQPEVAATYRHPVLGWPSTALECYLRD